MTSTPFTSDVYGADDHPDVTEISALIEDAVSPERSSVLRAHLSGCEPCTDVRASLEEIRDMLGTLPGPVRMPADIAGRIDAALAAEALLDASPADPAAVSRETGPGDAQRGRHTRAGGREGTARKHGAHVSRETAASRSGGPGRPADRPADRPAGHPGGSSGPGRHRPAKRTRRWRSAVLAGAGAVVALGIGGLVMQSMYSPSSPTKAGGAEQGKRETADGALEKHVQSLLAEEDSTGEPTAPRTPDLKSKQSPGNSPLAGSASSIPSCIREGIDRAETPLAVDENAPYKGSTGYLVVLPNRGDSQRVDAYVVDRSCTTGETSGPGEVLTTRTYSRH